MNQVESDRNKMVYKTFQELCPMWDVRITEGPTTIVKLRQYLHDIHSFRTCVVGEAYGNLRISDEQIKQQDIKTFVPRCNRCEFLGNAISMMYTTYRSNVGEPISEFVEHFNEAHRERSPI